MDVEAWLETLPTGTLDKWAAAQLVDPFDDEWLQAGTIASAIDRGFRMLFSAWGGGKIKPEDLPKPSDYIPTYQSPEEREAAEPKPFDAVAAMKRASGL